MKPWSLLWVLGLCILAATTVGAVFAIPWQYVVAITAGIYLAACLGYIAGALAMRAEIERRVGRYLWLLAMGAALWFPVAPQALT